MRGRSSSAGGFGLPPRNYDDTRTKWATVAGRFLSVSTNMVEAGAGEGHAWLAV